MINVQTRANTGVPLSSIETLIAEHGAWQVLKTAIAALLKERKRYQATYNLPNRLRADIGLPPIQEDNWRPLPIVPLRSRDSLY